MFDRYIILFVFKNGHQFSYYNFSEEDTKKLVESSKQYLGTDARWVCEPQKYPGNPTMINWHQVAYISIHHQSFFYFVKKYAELIGDILIAAGLISIVGLFMMKLLS